MTEQCTERCGSYALSIGPKVLLRRDCALSTKGGRAECCGDYALNARDSE